MFGYLITDLSQLTKQDKEIYKSFYCGLCHCLKTNYGNSATKFLSYDLTFINILLSSYHNSPQIKSNETCWLHPIKNHQYIINDYSNYCSDINLLLSYYKAIDDYNDDHNLLALKQADNLKDYVAIIENNYPFVAQQLNENLSKISDIEKNDILNPDYNCDYFGKIMASICDCKNNDSNLYNFGYHLGRFIYLMDAVMDLKSDLKKQRYNPLFQIDSSKFKEMLIMIMGQVDVYYRKLNIETNKSILDNVIYSGIWQQFEIKSRRKK